jgi:hypothetical protein
VSVLIFEPVVEGGNPGYVAMNAHGRYLLPFVALPSQVFFPFEIRLPYIPHVEDTIWREFRR